MGWAFKGDTQVVMFRIGMWIRKSTYIRLGVSLSCYVCPENREMRTKKPWIDFDISE
jgi:hypothetical protein